MSDKECIAVENVLGAIEALYLNPDTAIKEQANAWLGQFQKSIHAWSLCDQILHIKHDLNSCYFAAQTMRTKIQFQFGELPLESHESLKKSLLEHVGRLTIDTQAAISVQLCLAVADLALQMVHWKMAVNEIIQTIGSHPDRLCSAMEILRFIPEEINSTTLRLGANRRDEVRSELELQKGVVLQFLTACLNHFLSAQCVEQRDRLLPRLFSCCGAWWQTEIFTELDLRDSALVTAPFDELSRMNCPAGLHDASADSIVFLFYALEQVDMFPLLAQHLFERALRLLDCYHMCAASDDVDRCVNYCRVLTELAETCLCKLISQPGVGLGNFATLDSLLTCAEHDSTAMIEMEFNFWYRLSEELYNSRTQVSLFRPYVERLIVILSTHCQYDPEDASLDDDDFIEFRIRVADLIHDVVFVIGGQQCFIHMINLMKSQPGNVEWNITEATLFILTTVAKSVSSDESVYTPQIVQMVLSLPTNTHPVLLRTAVQLLGELSNWIEGREEEDYLGSCVTFILAALQRTELANAAATALSLICTASRDKMALHFNLLAQVVEALPDYEISTDSCVGLLRGVAAVISRLPSAEITVALRRLCAILSKCLERTFHCSTPTRVGEFTPAGYGPPPLYGCRQSDPCIWLDAIAGLFRHTRLTLTVGVEHPCLPVVQEVWPVLSRTLVRFISEVRVIERTCRVLRFIIRCVSQPCVVLLPLLVAQMVELYRVHQHSCFLYLGGILVDEYGTETSCQQGLVDMLNEFYPATVSLFTNGTTTVSLNGLSSSLLAQHPDTVEDLFRLCTRLVQRCPCVFLASPHLNMIFSMAIIAVPLEHRDANGSVTKFLSELLILALESERVFEAVTDHQQQQFFRHQVISLLTKNQTADGSSSSTGANRLIRALLHAALFYLPAYMLDDLSEVFWPLLCLNKGLVCNILEDAVLELPLRRADGFEQATEVQVRKFHSHVSEANGVRQVTEALRDFARLFR